MIAPITPRLREDGSHDPILEAGNDPVDAPWVVDPRVWLPRLVHLRLLGMVPVIGLLLWEVQQGIVSSATGLFGAAAAFTVSNLAAFVLGRRVRSPTGAQVLLASSFCVDVVFLIWVAQLGSGVGGPMSAFLILPVLLASLTLPEGGGVLIAAVAAVTLLAVAFVGGSDPVARGASIALSLLLVSISFGVRWYRRRSRYLERRVRLLEERARVDAARQREALPLVPAGAREIVDSDSKDRAAARSGNRPSGRRLEVVARSLAADMREPNGLVRARAENLRYELADHPELSHLLTDLDRMLSAADRLEDVRLTLSALSGERASTPASTDVRSVASEVIRALESSMVRDGVRLRIEAPRSLLPVSASHNEVRLTLARLLQVARLASLAQSRTIRLAARFVAMESGIALFVDDPLPGPDMDSDLFDPARELKRRPSLCVVLATVRTVVAFRGGEVTVGRSPKGGLRVRAWWPLAKREASKAVVEVAGRKPGAPEADRASGVVPGGSQSDGRTQESDA